MPNPHLPFTYWWAVVEACNECNERKRPVYVVKDKGYFFPAHESTIEQAWDGIIILGVHPTS